MTIINASTRLRANWKKDLQNVENRNVQDLVEQISRLVTVKAVLTDGLNDDGSGCEVVFEGKSSGALGGEKSVKCQELSKMCKLMSAAEDKYSMESELSVNDNGDMVLLILAD